jgi:hypothetical protein
MRTNSGVRFAGSASNCEAYCNEFYTGAGGAAGVELETGATNVKIHNNYFHDITGTSPGYGAIGYGSGLPSGDKPTGTGHQYYNNLIVSSTYGVSNVPSSAVSSNNIIVSCATGIAQGTDTNNIKTASGYLFGKNGSNGQGNTYWTVTSGPLASAFSGMKIGIDPGIPAGP